MKYKKLPIILTETFSEKQIRKSNKENGILLLDLETNRTCNLRCNYCFIGDMPNVNLTFDKLKNIIDQASKLGVKTIDLIGGGDSTIYSSEGNNILHVINYINSKGIDIEMFTNGLVFGDDRIAKSIYGMSAKELAKIFFKKKVTVAISIKSLNEEDYDKISGTKGNYKFMRKALENLISVGYTKDLYRMPQLVGEMVITRQNSKQIPKLFRFMRDRKIIPSLELIRISGIAVRNKKKLALDKKQIKNLFNNLLEIDRKEYGLDWFPVPPHIGYFCDLNRYSAYITIEGVVYNCECFGLKFGNVFRKSLKEILKHPNVKKMRNLANHIGGNCKSCPHLINKKGGFGDCFGGCVGQAYAEKGTVFAGDPFCWQNG